MSEHITIGLIFAGSKSKINIPCLDYDNKSGINDIKKLIEQFKLGSAQEICSRKGSHWFFPFDNSRSWKEVKRIIQASSCDPDYKKFGWVGWRCLRIGKKYNKSDLRLGKFVESRYPGKGDEALGTFLLAAIKVNVRLFRDWGLIK